MLQLCSWQYSLPVWWAISILSPEFVSWWSIHFRGVIMCIRLLIWKTLNSSIFLHPFSNSAHWETSRGDTETADNCPHFRWLLITPGTLDLLRKGSRCPFPLSQSHRGEKRASVRGENSLVTSASGSWTPDKQTCIAAHQSWGWGAGAWLNCSFHCISAVLLLSGAKANK